MCKSRCTLAILIVVAAAAVFAADANDHRMWMDEMENLSLDLTDAFTAKDAPKVAAAIDQMIEYQILTERYWADAKQDDIVKLAQDNLALGRVISAAAKAGNLAEAEARFKEMSANCTACHDRRPERRLPGARP